VSGHSFVDQARITGESMPIEKVAGTTVYAGSINASGVLEVRAERIGRDTSYGRIIEAVERAERSRAPVQRLADRLAAYLVYLARGAALPVRAGSPPAHRSPFSAASAARRGSARSLRAESTSRRSVAWTRSCLTRPAPSRTGGLRCNAFFPWMARHRKTC